MSEPTDETLIDLSNGHDIQMIYSALVRGWAIPPERRQAIIDQLPGALDAAKEDARRLGMLVKVARKLDVTHPLVESFVPPAPKVRRKRRPRRV